MDIDDGIGPLNSLNFMNEEYQKTDKDKAMEQDDEFLFNMEVEVEDCFHQPDPVNN